MASKINIGTEINLEDLLQSRLLIQANSGGGKSVIARVIIEESFGKVPFIVMDIEGEYYTLKEKYGDVLIIGGQYADIQISMKSVRLLPKEIIGNRLSVVLDLSDMKMNERILYAKYFLEAMMDLPNEYWINYLVFIEEAHKLCGEQDKQASAEAVKDLMSRGRKRGYCGILLTQRISKLHKDAAAECNNKFIGRTFLDIDMDRSAKELGFSSGTDKNILRVLQPGHFYSFGTSIIPHHVHTVKIKLPKTKIPKAGVSLDIKPQKPTEKLKSMLAKLNDLPQEAVKELNTIKELQTEVNKLKGELSKSAKVPVGVLSSKDAAMLEKLKQDNQQLKSELQNESLLLHKTNKELIKAANLLSDISSSTKAYFDNKAVAETKKNNSILPVAPVAKSFTKHNSEFATKVYDLAAKSNSKLGRCSAAILEFLSSYPDRSWSRAQIGVAVGYSPTSSGFANSLSELNTKGLILPDGIKRRVNPAANVGEWIGIVEKKEYNIHTFKNKLGKCEREIYEVLLAHPTSAFSKEELASKTESNYSPTSSGYANSLSSLNTLELIKREAGMIKLNPELLEINN